MTTILVLTDEPLLEAGLGFLLNSCAEFETHFFQTAAQMTGNGPQASPKNAPPNVVVCVLRPNTDLALSDLRVAAPQASIVVLGRDISPEFARQALQMGVRGFVSTTASPKELIECLLAAARGELWMERALSMALLDTRAITLSRRQTQLIQLLAQGLKNKEIASALGLSEGTVKAYLTALFEKVGVKDRFELALFGLKSMRHIGQDTGLLVQDIDRSWRSTPRRRTQRQIA